MFQCTGRLIVWWRLKRLCLAATTKIDRKGDVEMNASDIMTKTVITGKPETTVAQAADLMARHHISAIPVLDESDGVVGLVSEGDLMRRVEGANDRTRSWWLSLFADSQTSARDFVRERGQHLKDIMTTQVTTVSPETPVGEIARLLEKNPHQTRPRSQRRQTRWHCQSRQPLAGTSRTTRCSHPRRG